jgi:hypothetical protein
MRYLAIMLSIEWLVGCQPSWQAINKEQIFELRSRCSKLAFAWERSQTDGSFTYTVTSHYDPEVNRCLMWVRATGDVAEHVSLIDAQSHAELAECTSYKERKAPDCVLRSKPATKEEVFNYIAERLGDDKDTPR